MLECLQTEGRTNREELGASQGLRKGEMRAGQELLKEEMRAKLDAHQERMTAKMIYWIEGMEAYVGKLETSPENLDAVAEHQEVHKEEAMVEAIGALED